MATILSEFGQTLFQKLTVRILLDDSNVQHEKLVLKLVSPHIKDFSVQPMDQQASSNGTDGEGKKRKSSDGEGAVTTPAKKAKK